VTSVQFEQDGDVVTADSDGFITIYSVDADGAYFVRMEFEVRFDPRKRIPEGPTKIRNKMLSD